jgi:hypothetical protein
MISETDFFKWLNNKDLVSSYQVLDFKQSKESIYIKLKIIFTDKTELHTKEYITKDNRIYSFHWQNIKGDLLYRWDNAPHYKNLITFPHHKHCGKDNSVIENYDISLPEILEFISKLTNKK